MAGFKCHRQCQSSTNKKGQRRNGKYRLRHAFNFPEMEVLLVPLSLSLIFPFKTSEFTFQIKHYELMESGMQGNEK